MDTDRSSRVHPPRSGTAIHRRHEDHPCATSGKKVEVLREDDSRYYHRCRFNQSLHLVSAVSFVLAYALLFVDPAAAALLGWLVGYNMRRKSVLIGVWLSLPVLLPLSRGLLDLIEPAAGWQGYVHDLGLGWLALGVGGLLFRTVHFFFLRGVSWGLAWAMKIVTDPFHSIAIYWKSPLALLQGQRFDPMGTDRHPAQS